MVHKNKIDFFRYQAIAYLTDEANNGLYQSAQTISRSLAFIMQTQLIKRLESSFYAFKNSLNKITASTKQMIEMYERDSIFIAPDLDISDLLNKGYTDEEIEIATEDAYAMVRQLAQREGWFVGVSAAANIVAALQVAARIEQGVIVTILCDGGSRYLSEKFWDEA